MAFEPIERLVDADGLRLVIVGGLPSPWSQSARAMIEYKGLDYRLGAQVPGGENAELVAWCGENSGPVVAWNDEPPLSRWEDILRLIERLNPERPLLPAAPADRVAALGLAHELCAPGGYGWNLRVGMFHRTRRPDEAPNPLATKYGYSPSAVAAADAAAIRFLDYLAQRLEAQWERGSDYLVGDALSAVDFYWAAFGVLTVLPGDDVCPLEPPLRRFFELAAEPFADAVDPLLLAHRDRILSQHFRRPLAF